MMIVTTATRPARGAHLNLREEAAVGRDAVPAVLHEVQRVLPVELVVLHHEHDDKRRGEANAACDQ